jgi:ribosomal-protein-alanine N-acetyltransferase
MIVRLIEKKDVPYIQNQPGQLLGQHLSRQEIEKEVLKNTLATYYIAEDARGFCGYLGLWLYEDKAEIVTLYVNEERRREGVASLLVGNVLERLQAIDVRCVTLEVSVNNHAAISLYEQQGFQAVALRKQYYQDGSDARLMIKELTDEHSCL